MTNLSGGIFSLGDDGTLVQLSEQPYDSEDVLQTLLERHPELLAGELIDPDVPRQWLLISREIPFAGDDGDVGRVDHVLIDQDGVPTFVEVKRSTDTRIRREVVGQLLEYAANAVVFWNAADMRQRLGDTSGGEEAAEEEVRAFLGDADPEAWWEQVQTNLRARKVRMRVRGRRDSTVTAANRRVPQRDDGSARRYEPWRSVSTQGASRPAQASSRGDPVRPRRHRPSAAGPSAASHGQRSDGGPRSRCVARRRPRRCDRSLIGRHGT